MKYLHVDTLSVSVYTVFQEAQVLFLLNIFLVAL